MTAPRVLVGLVGYTPVVEAYPLGPSLMTRLGEAFADDDGDIVVENFSWSPIHVVQRFQDEGAARFERVVLAGASAVSGRPGRIEVWRWGGGTLPPEAVQARVYEAVTGIVDLENTLVIGDHFGVWPAKAVAVEIDLPASLFGELVQLGARGITDPMIVSEEVGFDVAGATAAFAEAIVDCATGDLQRLPVRIAEDLTPPQSFMQARLRPRAEAEATP